LDTHKPPKETVELYGMDVCEDNEHLFLDILSKDECDHSSEKTCVKDIMSKVFFERRKFDLSICTFNILTNDQLVKNITQEPQIDKSFKNLFEDELNHFDESINDALVSYIHPKDMITPSFVEMYEEELKILSIDIIYVPTTMDEFVTSGGGKRSRRKLRKVMNKLERMNTK